ncbi:MULTISPECIES: 1,2-phenylacetyl-CoA epoxidase subunit PaaC [Methylobacterium]|uniref:1,2-phenylacetyl-CoA epoxidase subunit PaaC n=1 Tax=Methylobacterium TaxID=407 RepID=UPI0013EA4125|nr:1,2-phenylacetyl-CoA epoxidase subunit PaaC [Methylobacterium sp. DB0501]NGM34053.1 phenylacetate-CoA oxygenase subunit PaaC [Methylobacterium sp. DB0501]
MPSLPDVMTQDAAALAAAAAAAAGTQPAPDASHATPHDAPLSPARAALFEFLTRMGDNTLVLGHRLSEWCGHGPVLEEDIGVANVALDLIGQTQFWLGLAGEVEGRGRSADDLAFLRDVWDFRNVLLVELPNGDFGRTIMRQFLFDAWHAAMLQALTTSSEARVAEIAVKAIKEVHYHLEKSADLVVRLGDGTQESRRRMQDALDLLWVYAGEFFLGDATDAVLAEAGIAPDPASLRPAFDATVLPVLAEATLAVPAGSFAQKGGRRGIHTEHLGRMLAEMQFLQRAYPGATW